MPARNHSQKKRALMDLSYLAELPLSFPAAPPRYRIDALCGRGGTGSVYRAWDRELTRWVALKFLHDELPQHRLRMLREARAQARIDHAHVCRIFDVGEQGDRLYIAMQWIDGERLDAIAPALTTEQKVAVLRDVADAINAANSEGIIHRDVKPANVLVERRADETLHPYVVDFGLARSATDAMTTATGDIVGTPQYVSPEQAWGLPVDRRSDVYSLGATLYHALAGVPPFSGDSAADVLMQVITRAPRPLHRLVRTVPLELSIITDKCLGKEPERRYGSARELRDELDCWIRGEPISARAPGVWYRTRSFIRRNRAIAAGVAGATLLTGMAAALALYSMSMQQTERELIARLEDRVRYIERLVQYDRALPLHDTRPHVARVQKEIVRLAAEAVGAKAGAPLLYAEGRARLATGDARRGHQALARAWSSGLRTPAVGFHLGVALVDEYARELAEAERITPAETRAAKVRDLRERYRRAALPPLIAARSYQAQPAAMIEARIAFIEGNDHRAAKLAGDVLERFPWNTDARLLSGEAMLRSARANRMAGHFTQARSQAAAVAKMYEQARLTAPSDVRVLEGLCSTAALQQQLTEDVAGGEEAAFAHVRSECQAALIADPTRLPPLLALASGWTRVAFFRGRTGGDAEAARREAIAAAERALRVAPEHPAALIEAGAAYFWMPLSYAPRVTDYMRRALRADPSSVQARHGLARALLRLNDLVQSRGGDPRAILAEAAGHYREVIRQAPSYVSAQQNLGFALNHLAEYSMRTGASPEPYYRQMIDLMEPRLAAHPEASGMRYIAALAWAGIAHWRSNRDEDPSEAIARARALYDSAIAINRDHFTSRAARASLELLSARHAPDPKHYAAAIAAADADLTHVERLGSPSAVRVDWYLARARAAERHDERMLNLARAIDSVDRVIPPEADYDPTIDIYKGKVEQARCRLQLPKCDPAAAEKYYARAVAHNRLLAYTVAQARRE